MASGRFTLTPSPPTITEERLRQQAAEMGFDLVMLIPPTPKRQRVDLEASVGSKRTGSWSMAPCCACTLDVPLPLLHELIPTVQKSVSCRTGRYNKHQDKHLYVFNNGLVVIGLVPRIPCQAPSLDGRQ